MNARQVALYLGVVVLVTGLAGFVPALVPDGKVFGIFLVDPLHNIVHTLTGALGILASRSSESATRMYFKVFGLVYTLVVISGLLTGTGLFGLLPTNTADLLLHVFIAVVGIYYGFVEKGKVVKKA